MDFLIVNGEIESGKDVDDMKQFIREIEESVKLYRDDKNGIAWIEDGSTGLELVFIQTLILLEVF